MSGSPLLLMSYCLVLINDQKRVCAGRYDLTVKLTFDPSDLKCYHFIRLYIFVAITV